MTIEEFLEAYNYANENNISRVELIKRTIKFKNILQKHLTPEFDEAHFKLLTIRHHKLLYQTVRGEFYKRPNAESFLIKKLPTVSDTELQADILQILGNMRSNHALSLAKEYLEHDYDRHREVALFVIGWVGLGEDIAILRRHMLNENNPRLRITAASAHRQIAWYHEDLKDAVLKSLKIGYENEKDDEVLSWIIVMIGTVSGKKLGLREDREDPDVIHGDLEKAKIKTKKFLATIQ